MGRCFVRQRRPQSLAMPPCIRVGTTARARDQYFSQKERQPAIESYRGATERAKRQPSSVPSFVRRLGPVSQRRRSDRLISSASGLISNKEEGRTRDGSRHPAGKQGNLHHLRFLKRRCVHNRSFREPLILTEFRFSSLYGFAIIL